MTRSDSSEHCLVGSGSDLSFSGDIELGVDSCTSWVGRGGILDGVSDERNGASKCGAARKCLLRGGRFGVGVG